MPYIPDIIVGIAITRVMEVKNFIALLSLLLIMVETKSLVPWIISLYIFVISIACLFSTITSSRSSLSSGYCFILSYLVSLSRTILFALNDVAKYTRLVSSSCRLIRSSSSVVVLPILFSISLLFLSITLRYACYRLVVLSSIWYTNRSFFLVLNPLTENL